METKYFFNLIIMAGLILVCFSTFDTRHACPSSTGTIVSDRLRVAVDGQITLNNQDSYCYNYTMYKNFQRKPKVAVALNKFQAQETKNLYLMIKPIAFDNSKDSNSASSNAYLTTISFSVVLYQHYTRWILVEFFFLAEDKPQVQAGYHLIDGAALSKCDSGKTILAYLPFSQQMQGKIQAYTFLHGFEISSKPFASFNDKYSPIELQIINKQISSSGVTVTLSVTSSTQVYSILISYIAFQPRFNKVFGGSYIYENYELFPSQTLRPVTHSPKVYVEQIWSKIYGISGFIVNSNTFDVSFDAGDFTSIWNFKINNFWKYFSYEYVLFLGGLCSDCEGFEVFYLGKCIKECPATTVFNGYTCIKCSQTEIWNGTHCINRCSGGKLWINANCLCSTNLEWNGFNCAPCFGGKIWQSNSPICICPSNMIWNGHSCVVCNGGRILNPSTKQCICPLSTTWNGISCTTICPPQQYWNSTINKCQCATNTIWTGSNCIQCSGARFYNSFTRTCECQNGIWNGFLCGTTCGNGMNWNSNLGKCECPKRTYSHNGGCIACGSMAGDNMRPECRCPGFQTYFNGFDCILCDKGRVYNEFIGTCLCQQNKKWNGTACTSNLCGTGYQQIGKSCFCPLNSIQSNGQCVFYKNCQTGMTWNNQIMRCQPIQCEPRTFWNGQTCHSNDQHSDCPFGTYWNNFYCSSYADTCPQGTQWNGDYCITVDKNCQPGTYWTGSACANIPSQCPAQLTWKQDQKRCVPAGNICPSGTYYNGFTCMPYSSCKNGQVWSNILVQCICPQNSHWNGISCVLCSGGMSYSNAGCFCPLGTFLEANSCTRIPQKNCASIPYSRLNGAVCDCLPGFDKVQSTCICQGILNGNECDKCIQKPNSIWTGFTCQCTKNYIEVFGKCKLISQSANPNRQRSNSTRNQCTVGTYFEIYEQKCLLCSDGCLSCKNCYDCQQCRPQYNYFAPSRSCVEICGDGKRFSLQCDDGNNANGDGCSSDCRIQPEFTCNGGSPNSKDSCSKHKPQKIDLIATGQTHLFGKIVLNVMVNYLPTNLTTNVDECKQSCDKILLVKLIDGAKTFLSIKTQYIKTTSFSFSIEIEFGRQPIQMFTAQIAINERMQEKYFAGMDITKTIQVKVNPAFLALVSSKKQDLLV